MSISSLSLAPNHQQLSLKGGFKISRSRSISAPSSNPISVAIDKQVKIVANAFRSHQVALQKVKNPDFKISIQGVAPEQVEKHFQLMSSLPNKTSPEIVLSSLKEIQRLANEASAVVYESIDSNKHLPYNEGVQTSAALLMNIGTKIELMKQDIHNLTRDWTAAEDGLKTRIFNTYVDEWTASRNFSKIKNALKEIQQASELYKQIV